MSNTMDINLPRRYFSMHFFIFRFLGLGWWHHPDERNIQNFPGLYIYYSIFTEIFLVAAFIGLESIDPFIGEKDLDRFMISLSFVITHDLTLIKIYIFFFKNREIQDIVHTLEIDLRQFYQNYNKISRTIRKTQIMTGSFVFFGWVTIANTNAYGIVQDIRWRAEVTKLNNTDTAPLRTLPQPIYIPWDYQSDVIYISTFLLETVGLLWTGDILLTIDTFIGSIILHMSSQFVILQEAIITAYDRTIYRLTKNINADNDDTLIIDDSHNKEVEDYYESLVQTYYTKKEIEKALEDSLKICIRQHQMLISCVEKFASTYSYGFMTQLISSLAVICVVMVQISQDASSFKSIRLATSLAFFAAMIIQLAIQCFTGNELTLQAGLVSEAVMQCKWERMPPRLCRLLVMTMMRAQRPIHLSAAGYTKLDNDCFVAVSDNSFLNQLKYYTNNVNAYIKVL
ncbi:unnamed protein product [Euphydryas editha]|uniref:Odorant receptor n=2 Tax=Euphydryas editha TaxID=104508 RepID=A0AAU9V615_EUPED|nr:unnamed protein product [Euphydryas editha]